MKKFLLNALAAILGAALLVGLCGCGAKKEEGTYTVYSPDGAPALSLVNGIEKKDARFEYHVIASATIEAQVTGANPAADFCVLPLNLASKLLGSGTAYQLLGTVTNGNVYFVSTYNKDDLTPQNFKTALIGKTVGVVQLANVPGLTLQVVLKENEVPYQVISNRDAEKAADKVNLLNMGTDAGNVAPDYGCDYYLVPEPAATAKVVGTSMISAAESSFKIAGDLQQLYGEGGYPQAVLVGKTQVLSSDKAAVKKLLSYFEESATYLASATPATVISAIEGVLTQGLKPSFNDKNLKPEVIAHCSVKFTASKDCKTAVNAFLAKLIAVNANSASAVADAFYYGA